MNECGKYREMISAMLDGELDANGSERLIAHLSSCAECRELYELLSAVSGGGVWELPEVPEGLHERIMSGVRAEAAARRKRARVVRLRPVAVAAACLVLIVGVVFGVPRVFRMGGGYSGAPAAMFNTSASAASNSAPANDSAQDNAAVDTAAPAEGLADNNAGASSDVPVSVGSDGEFEGWSYASQGGSPEAAPVPEPEATEDKREETEALDIDIERSILTVERDGKSVSERLSRYDTLLWLRVVIEGSGGGFDAARLEVFRAEGADYEVYFFHDGAKLMGSLSEGLEDAIELEELADFAKFAEMADGGEE